MSVASPAWVESSIDRLWLDRLVIGERQECWEWDGCHDERGYARSGEGLVHRLVSELVNGEDAPYVHHLCRNPRCINPEHLEPVHSQLDHSARHPMLTCKRGHDLTEHDAMTELSNGNRRCRRCHAIRERERRRHKVKA